MSPSTAASGHFADLPPALASDLARHLDGDLLALLPGHLRAGLLGLLAAHLLRDLTGLALALLPWRGDRDLAGDLLAVLLRNLGTALGASSSVSTLNTRVMHIENHLILTFLFRKILLYVFIVNKEINTINPNTCEPPPPLLGLP